MEIIHGNQILSVSDFMHALYLYYFVFQCFTIHYTLCIFCFYAFLKRAVLFIFEYFVFFCHE